MRFYVIRLPRFLSYIISKLLLLFGGRKTKKAWVYFRLFFLYSKGNINVHNLLYLCYN